LVASYWSARKNQPRLARENEAGSGWNDRRLANPFHRKAHHFGFGAPKQERMPKRERQNAHTNRSDKGDVTGLTVLATRMHSAPAVT
jgi:hypothetical protein